MALRKYAWRKRLLTPLLFLKNIIYEWVVSPAENGTIINGQGSENVEVLWHSDGLATVSLAVCGAVENINVEEWPLPKSASNPSCGKYALGQRLPFQQ